MKEKTPKKAYKDPTADLAIGRIMRGEKYKYKASKKNQYQKRQIRKQDRRGK